MVEPIWPPPAIRPRRLSRRAERPLRALSCRSFGVGMGRLRCLSTGTLRISRMPFHSISNGPPAVVHPIRPVSRMLLAELSQRLGLLTLRLHLPTTPEGRAFPTAISAHFGASMPECAKSIAPISARLGPSQPTNAYLDPVQAPHEKHVSNAMGYSDQISSRSHSPLTWRSSGSSHNRVGAGYAHAAKLLHELAASFSSRTSGSTRERECRRRTPLRRQCR